ncbi:MAG TPA: DUF4149 domain-containing protein [Burkholderiaceae bacterium]|nr:DUF4149 domain-containing protein [Burkholderiaceae bacterium]
MRLSAWLKFPAALWWGSLTTLGFFVVPLLFGHLPSKQLAGNMVARLFEVQTWVSVACGLILLLAIRFQNRPNSDTVDISEKYMKNQPVATVFIAYDAIIYIALGMLLALLITFGVAPRIVTRDNLMLWHTMGSVMYFAQWVCASVVLWKVR